MVFSELHPTNADFSSFLANEGKLWADVSLVPWNAGPDNRSFIVVESPGEQAGWGTPFDVKCRPSSAQSLAVVKLYFTPVLVRLPEDRQVLILHRNLASMDHLLKVVDSYIRFFWPTFAERAKLKWFFPQLEGLTADAVPDSRALQDLTVPQFCDRFATRNVSFPSFRIDVSAGPEFTERELELQRASQVRLMNRVVHVFQKLEMNGKLLCPAPGVFGCIARDKPSKLIQAWDDFALKPRAPAQEVNFPILEIFNTGSIESTLVKYDKLPEAEKTRERLEVMLAAKLMSNIFPRNVRFWAQKLASVTEVAGALRRTGNVKRDSDRPFMQKEAEHLLTSAAIGIEHADPWYELSLLARMVVERIWTWVKAMKEDPIAVPHDLLPYKYVSQFNKIKLRARGEQEPRAVAPPGLHMAGKIAKNRALICVNRHPVEFVVAAKSIVESDFEEVVSIIDTVIEAFAWDVPAHNGLRDVRKAIRENQPEAAKSLWKSFIEATKEIPKARGSTFVLIVSKLTYDPIANGVAKNVGILLNKTDQVLSNQAIIRVWRNRFGGGEVVVQPPLFPPIPQPAKVANRRLALAAPRNNATEDIFKPSENMTFCAVRNCELHLEDLFCCPLHHRVLVDKLKETKVATIAPKDFGDVYLAKRVWAAESLPAQTPLDLLNSYFRAHYHLEALALHNPELDLELPAKQLRHAQVIYHTPGVDLNWADRSFWRNKELVFAVESVIKHFSPACYDYFEIKRPVPPYRAVLPPQGEALVWEVLPGHIDYRNDPNSDFNVGRDEEQIGGWKTQVLRPEFSPSLGKYSSVGRQQSGTSIVFSIEELEDGTRRIMAPVIAAVRDGRSYLVDPMENPANFPDKCRDIEALLTFPVTELLRQMRSKAKQKLKCESFFGFPELFTMAGFAELHKSVNFAVAFKTVKTLQRAKNYLLRYGKQEGHTDHPDISLFAAGKAEGEDHLPQCFYLYKKGANMKIWRPVRPGLTGPVNLWPKTYDERYEIRFVAHMLSTAYFAGGVSTDNLLGLIIEDLYPSLEGRRRELRRDLELAIASTALLIDLNDAKALSKLNFVGGELSFNKKWQHCFHFFKEHLQRLRHGSTSIRAFQEEGRRVLLEKHFPEVFNVRRIRPWLKSFLPKDPRFTREVVNEMVTSLHDERRGFPFEERAAVESLMREWFMNRTKDPEVCPSLFKKPSPPPPAPLRAMWLLQRERTGHYSQAAEYEAAKARVEEYFEARHQKALEYRRQAALEEEEERRRSSTPPLSDSIASYEGLSTDSEEDTSEAPEPPAEEVLVLEPEQEPQPPQQDPFMFNEWRDNLPGEEEYSSDESALTSDDENVDECPEPDNPIEEVDVPLPRDDLIRPVTPEDPAEQPPRAMAQIVEDREFRPAPNEQEEFECKRYFPHTRYDRLFDSGDADKFAEYALKTREGVRQLLEKDLEHISHERVATKVEAVFQEALQPNWFLSKLNRSQERNTDERTNNVVPDAIPGRLDPFGTANKVLNEDFARLNKGIKPEGVWKVDGEIIVPHRSDRKVRFTDEINKRLITLVAVRGDWGKLYFPLAEAESTSEDLPAVRPLPMSTYGKWKAPVVYAQSKNARKARRRLEQDPNTHYTRNMKTLGIEYEAQYIRAEDITIHETREEQIAISRLAQTITDKGMGLTEKANEAADELLDLIRENNLSVTLILANLCDECGTLRASTIRSELRKSAQRRGLENCVSLWAASFKNKEGQLY